jgi:putative aldouronate transport system substrate-binding protein
MGNTTAGWTRRKFVSRGGWAALASVGMGMLAACSSSAPAASGPTAAAAKPTAGSAAAGATSAPAVQATTAPAAQATTAPATAATTAPATGKPAAGARVQLPTYVAPKGPAPDVPGTDIIPPGFRTYPKNPTQTVPNPPGDGGDVTIAGEVFTALIPYDNNTLWQQLNKAMNVNLKLNLAPFSDWAFGKFQAMVAGGDLPDFTMIPIGGVIPELPAFLEAKIQDLTPFVGGDAIKEYPNLAALPSIGWKGMVYNNKIFAVPLAQSQFYWGLWGHQEILEANKLGWPKSATEFRQQMKQLTNPQQNKFGIGFEVGNRYAFGNTNVGGQLWPAIYGAPNNWGVSSSGKWTKDWETDQFKAGVQLAHDVLADGSFDPSTTYTTPTADDAFESGRFAYRFSNALNVNHFDTGAVPIHRIMATQDPPWKLRLAPPLPAEAGGKPQYNLGIGNFGLIVLKKASPERIKYLLNIINYIVAPFGSQEYLITTYGVKDQDYKLDDNGNPQRTQQGLSNMISWLGAMGVPAPVLFDPQNQDFAPMMNQSLQALSAGAVQDPTVGLYAPTNQNVGFSIQTQLADGLIDIIVGRRPMTDYDQLVSTWRSAGGDSIRSEFERVYAESRG